MSSFHTTRQQSKFLAYTNGKDLISSFSAPGCNANPWCVVYHLTKFFVSFPIVNCVIFFFYKEGEYLYDIGCEGPGDQQFSHPTGLAFDKFNHLIVCITENRGIFTLGGKCVAELAGRSFKGSRLAFMLYVKLDNCLLLMWKNTVFRYSIRTDVRKYLLGKDLLQLTLLVFLAFVSVESWKKNLRNLCI